MQPGTILLATLCPETGEPLGAYRLLGRGGYSSIKTEAEKRLDFSSQRQVGQLGFSRRRDQQKETGTIKAES